MGNNCISFFIDHKSAVNLLDMYVEIDYVNYHGVINFDYRTVKSAINSKFFTRKEAEDQLLELTKDVEKLKIVTKPHYQYMTPTQSYIEEVASHYNFDVNVNIELIQNLTNVFSYPDEEVEDAYIEEGELTDFIRSLDFTKFEGNTPLKKALSINASIVGLVKEKKKEEDKSKLSNSKTEKEEIEKPTSPNIQQAVNDFILEGTDDRGSDDKAIVTEEFQAKLGKLLSENSFNAKNLTQNTDLSSINSLSISREDSRIFDELSLFNDIKGLESKKKVTEFYDPTSKNKKERFIESYEELVKIPMIEYALPNFKKKLAAKEILYNKPFTSEIQKQSLIFIVDDSGSMSNKFKIGKVKGLLMNRLNQVIKGNAELYLTTYEYELDEDNWHHIKDEKDCQYIWDNFGNIFGFNRGGTNIQGAIETAKETFESDYLVCRNRSNPVKLNKYNPNICVICDGEDHVSTDFEPEGYVIHNFVLGNEHPQLKRISKETDGVYRLFKC